MNYTGKVSSDKERLPKQQSMVWPLYQPFFVYILTIFFILLVFWVHFKSSSLLPFIIIHFSSTYKILMLHKVFLLYIWLNSGEVYFLSGSCQGSWWLDSGSCSLSNTIDSGKKRCISLWNTKMTDSTQQDITLK